MTIYNHSGKELLNLEVTDESYRYRSIMQDNSVALYYGLTEHVELLVGSYIEFQGGKGILFGDRRTLKSTEPGTSSIRLLSAVYLLSGILKIVKISPFGDIAICFDLNTLKSF